MKLFSYCLFIGVCLLIISQPAYAQEVSLAVTPPVVEIMLAPNKRVSQTFNLEVTGDNLDLIPELHLVKPSGDTGHVEIDPSPIVPSDLPLTATISGPNTTPTVTLEAASTDIAKDVYLALVFRSAPLESISSNLTSFAPSISALMLVTINPSGVMPIDLDFKNFEVASYHDSSSPLTVRPQIDNHISIMIRPKGKYEVISPSGKILTSIDLYPNLVLGNSTRLVRGIIDDKPVDLTWSPQLSNIGPYKLRLTLTTEGGTKITETEKVVWVFPIRIVIVFILLITLILLTVRFKNSKFKSV